MNVVEQLSVLKGYLDFSRLNLQKYSVISIKPLYAM